MLHGREVPIFVRETYLELNDEDAKTLEFALDWAMRPMAGEQIAILLGRLSAHKKQTQTDSALAAILARDLMLELSTYPAGAIWWSVDHLIRSNEPFYPTMGEVLQLADDFLKVLTRAKQLQEAK